MSSPALVIDVEANPHSRLRTLGETMTDEEKQIIRIFAARAPGYDRNRALEIYRRYPLENSIHWQFMSEIDNPCPDYALRAHLRRQLIKEALLLATGK